MRISNDLFATDSRRRLLQGRVALKSEFSKNTLSVRTSFNEARFAGNRFKNQLSNTLKSVWNHSKVSDSKLIARFCSRPGTPRVLLLFSADSLMLGLN